MYGHQGGKGEVGMNWKIGIDIYTLPCIKQTTSENLVHSTRNSTQCSVVTKWEGNPKKRGYMYMYSSLTLQQKLTQYCKATILQ